MKLGIKKFDGEEVYKGLGPNFTEWGTHFMRRIAIAQIQSGFWWRSEDKVDCLQAHLSGRALRHFETQSPEWMRESPHLEFVMLKLLNAFTVKLTLDQAADIFRRPKPKNRAWNEHYIYLTEVSHSAGGMPRYVLDGIVKYAAPEFKATLLAKANMDTTTPLLEAERMANFAQSMTMEERPARALGRHINAIEESPILAVEPTICSYCKRKGHVVEECRTKKRDSNSKNKSNTKKGHQPRRRDENNGKEKNWTLFVTDQAPDNIVCSSNDKDNNIKDDVYEGKANDRTTEWILDSGCGRHLTGNANFLTTKISNASTSLYLPDGSTVQSTKRGTVSLKSIVAGETNNLTISDVEFVPGLTKNLLSYVRLERKGVRLIYEGQKRYLASSSSKLAEVLESGNLLVVRFDSDRSQADQMCSLLAEQDHPGTHEDTLHQFHIRLGHLSYATIEELASKPESGIKLTDHQKPQCITCAEGKQTRNNQSKKDSGNNAPIDRIGGVICSDLKGPITPTDRSGNRFMVNFIDYKTNYCRVFLAKTKDQAAKKFEHFLAWFERRFDCRIQVLRTDGGLEYRNIDPSARRQALQDSLPSRTAQHQMERRSECIGPSLTWRDV
jgi:hypothetical protein